MAEAVLKQIQDSLDPPAAAVVEPLQTKKPQSATDLTTALLELPKILSTLQDLAGEQRQQNVYAEIFSQIDSDIHQLVDKTDGNLQQISLLSAQVKLRMDGFDQLEAKYTRMIERVNGVLEQLERYLAKNL